MSTELAIIANNPDGPTPEQREKVRKIVASKTVTYLAPDKEPAVFLLFLMGQSLESISKQANYPLDVVYITAVHYNWHQKRSLAMVEGSSPVQEMQKSIAQMLMLGTYMKVQEELKALIRGEDPPANSLIPKNLNDLEKLMTFVSKMNGTLTPDGKIIPPHSQPIHAENVQINNYPTPTLTQAVNLTREELLKKAAQEKE